MEITRKTWGLKFNIFKNDLSEVSYLQLEPNRRCSWHAHRSKYNLFFVIEGEVGIKVEYDVDGGGKESGVTTIRAREFFTVSPGEWHEFQTYDEYAKLIEVMYVQYEDGDIIRKNIGGLLREVI